MPADISPRGRPAEVDELLHWNDQGLIPVITQQHDTGEVLMQAWADRSALLATLESGRATYFSRSRQTPWVKGESSGHVQRVIEVRTDCDGDALLYRVDQQGPACHQLRRTCFANRIDGDGSVHCDVEVEGS